MAYTPDFRVLNDVLKMPDYQHRRTALRSLSGDVFKADGIKSHDVEDAFIKSPIIGNGTGQVNPKATSSGLRYALGEDTLLALCAGEITPNDVLWAVKDPAHCGFKDSSTKTGFELGRPAGLTERVARDLKARIHAHGKAPGPSTAGGPILAASSTAAAPTTHTETAEMTAITLENVALSCILGSIDKAVLEHGLTQDKAIELATKVVVEGEKGAKKVTAAGHLMKLRDEAPKTVGEIEATLEPLDKALAAEAAKLDDDAGSDLWDEDADEGEGAGEASVAAPNVTPRYEVPADDSTQRLVNLALGQAGLPDIRSLLGEFNDMAGKLAEAQQAASQANMQLSFGGEAAVSAGSHGGHSGELPSGKVKLKKAYDALDLRRAKKVFDFDVPVWEWDGDHPHVPQPVPNYVYRPYELLSLLWALVTNKKAWLHGHTGSGKSVMPRQVASQLAWPMFRINFDSEITRMDLVGRDTITTDEHGNSVSKFVEGVLPFVMQGPYMTVLDELDYVRDDVAYVLQRALEEDGGLVLTEDGGRVIQPHKMFRIIACANTQGQGDEFGLYPGARVQSGAMLDRFTCWVEVEYLSQKQERDLVKKQVPSLSEDMADRIGQYVKEHRQAFVNAEVLKPISPRGIQALAEAIVTFTSLMPKERDAVQHALKVTLLNSASSQDRAVLNGIADRVFLK